MNLIISAGLTEPPTETFPFRNLTRTSKYDYKLDVLLESKQEMKDMYWIFLVKKGMFDYIADIVTPEERENGIRIDVEFNYPKTVVTKTIRFENERLLLKHIAILSVIK